MRIIVFEIRRRLLKACVLSASLYGSDGWTIGVPDKNDWMCLKSDVIENVES